MNKKLTTNILIIGNPRFTPSSTAFLTKFLNIFVNLTTRISYIGGDIPIRSNKITWIETSFKEDTNNFLYKFLNYLFFDIKLIALSFKQMVNFDYDLIFFLAPYPITMLLLRILSKIKVIRYQGGTYYHKSFSNRTSIINLIAILYSEIIPSLMVNYIIVESNSSIVFQKLEFFKNKIIIGHMYVDDKFFYVKKEFKDRDLCVGYVGSLSINKGIIEFIKAIPIINKQLDLIDKFIIIGDGPLYAYILNYLHIHKIDKKVVLTGWINHNVLGNFLNKITLIVLPFHSEGLPNIILESMACGTPVLTTKIGAIPDVINENINGFYLSSYDEKQISKKVLELITDHDLNEVSENSVKTIEKNFSFLNTLYKWKFIIDHIK